MGNLSDFLSGIKVIHEEKSSVNGVIKVVKGLAYGTYIQVEGLTQSGGILKSVWKKPLKKVRGKKLDVKSCLILGLGGGTVAGLVREFWPGVKITGVDLDPVMVKLGKEYLNLDSYDVDIIIGDAFDFVENPKSEPRNPKQKKEDTKYDLILVDLYIGREFPKKFEDDKFLRNTKKSINDNGIVIFNRLYYGEKRSEAVRFGLKLEKIFKNVRVIYPEANLMYLCS